MTAKTWRKSAADRRDARATKGSDASKSGPIPSKKKDTKRWCRGKVGVEHKLKCMRKTPMTMPSGKDIFANWRELRCTACGKLLDTWYPITWKTTNGAPVPSRPKPDWVVE